MIFSILIIVLFFATAVTCNFCGTPLDISLEENGTENDTETETLEEAQPSTEDSEEQQPATEEEPEEDEEPPATDEETAEVNNAPEILEIKIMDSDVQFLEEMGVFDEVEINPAAESIGILFTILAADEDGDELEYNANDSFGNDFEVNKISENEAQFYWNLPSETGPYDLNIEVSDSEGATDIYTIEMTLVLGTVDFVLPEEEEEAEEIGEVYSEGLKSFEAIAPLSGNINEDGAVYIAADSTGVPSIYVGDTETGLRTYGFLSFDISEISGANVLNAWFNLSGARIGEPGSLPTTFSVALTDYGPSLESSDFEVESNHLFGRPLGYSDFSFSNEELKKSVQDAIDRDAQYFQIKLLIHAGNGNGNADGFSFLLSNTSLEVSYN